MAHNRLVQITIPTSMVRLVQYDKIVRAILITVLLLLEIASLSEDSTGEREGEADGNNAPDLSADETIARWSTLLGAKFEIDNQHLLGPPTTQGGADIRETLISYMGKMFSDMNSRVAALTTELSRMREQLDNSAAAAAAFMPTPTSATQALGTPQPTPTTPPVLPPVRKMGGGVRIRAFLSLSLPHMPAMPTTAPSQSGGNATSASSSELCVLTGASGYMGRNVLLELLSTQGSSSFQFQGGILCLCSCEDSVLKLRSALPPLCLSGRSMGEEEDARTLDDDNLGDRHHRLPGHASSSASEEEEELSRRVFFIVGDLSTVENSKRVSSSIVSFIKLHRFHLKLLIHAAAAPPSPRYEITADGFEAQFAVNYLARAVLTHALIPHMAQAAEEDLLKGNQTQNLHGTARVIFLVSSMHHFTYRRQPPHVGRGTRHGEFTPRKHTDDELPPGYVAHIVPPYYYDPWLSYGQSMLMNLLFVRELASRARTNNYKRVKVYAVHPGYVLSGGSLQRSLSSTLRWVLWGVEETRRAALHFFEALRASSTSCLPSSGVDVEEEDAIGAGWTLRDGADAARAVVYACLTSNLRWPSGSYLAGASLDRGSSKSRDESMSDELWRDTVVLLSSRACDVL
ncbi:hypothetical protein PPROV_001125200 [Pycnococcus provasolii]|uniref:Uncharacterized protein n=1 Tax=Pycnococcus provasolii TaxID=41880 RepID=A0A830HZG8_9CHLO|nr:hypothetical protein PPROV_001125200 [Pycnococcus provasolii]